jgi:hypothetical protein
MVQSPQVPSDHLRHLTAMLSSARKQRYLMSLSETEFRDRIVRPIFICQGYTDGRDTCGPTEFGKDCYFTQTTAIGGTDVFVVQTKKGKITKASTPTENLHTIIAQLRTALDTPVPLIVDKKKKLPLAAFLIASGEINDNARSYIAAELPDPRLKFIDAGDLIPIIDDRMPEYWLNIDPDIVSPTSVP